MTNKQQQNIALSSAEDNAIKEDSPPLLHRRSNSDKSINNNITFLEPNSDLHSNFSLKTPAHGREQYKSPSFSDTNIYLLEVVEQPVQCRMSGNNEKDRRPIDPAPIVKLTVLNCDKDSYIESESESPFYVVHVSLWSTDMTQHIDIVDNARTLIGSTVCSSTLLKDMNGEKGYYFAFPDLSVRIPGQFRLHFSLVHLAVNKIITEVFSEEFTVYTAKAYPGMKESSEFSRHLANQGLKVTIRTLIRGKKDSALGSSHSGGSSGGDSSGNSFCSN